MMNKIPYKIYLSEDEMPKQWYNVRADMKNKPAPLLNPATNKPLTKAELEQVFCSDLCEFLTTAGKYQCSTKENGKC